jgi:hypothetical protein
MNTNSTVLLIIFLLLVWSLIVPLKRMRAFGNFLKKVLSLFPISRIVNTLSNSKE